MSSDLVLVEFEQLEKRICACQMCPRLVSWRETVAEKRRRAYQQQIYWGKPVPAFGDPQGRVLVVGLAPGAHGANRTGRMFTGDGSGEFLFRALLKAGFANQPTSVHRDDGLTLKDMLISAVCRCAPPNNRPTNQEMANCLPYLQAEINLMANLQVIVALGKIAFDNVVGTYRRKESKGSRLAFGHGLIYALGEPKPWLVVSYHPSRQNTQTGRLTAEMFAEIWEMVRLKLE
jgi:uracil-DNA glycosylase family 4